MGRKPIKPAIDLDDLTPEQQEELARAILSRKAKEAWAQMPPERRAEIGAAGRAKANAMRPKGTEAARKHTEAARKARAKALAAKKAAEKKAAE